MGNCAKGFEVDAALLSAIRCRRLTSEWSPMPEASDTHMWNLVAAVAMLFGGLASVTVFSILSKVGNGYRDEILVGVQKGMPLQLKHRWHILTADWVPTQAIIAGGLAVTAFAFLRIAKLAEDQGLTWLGYFVAAMHLWGFVMAALYFFLEGDMLVKHLRAAK